MEPYVHGGGPIPGDTSEGPHSWVTLGSQACETPLEEDRLNPALWTLRKYLCCSKLLSVCQ